MFNRVSENVSFPKIYFGFCSESSNELKVKPDLFFLEFSGLHCCLFVKVHIVK